MESLKLTILFLKDNKYNMEKEVYKIIDKNTGEAQGVYSRSYHDEFEFASAEAARTSNCHGIYEDKETYKISKFKVTYTLIEDECE